MVSHSYHVYYHISVIYTVELFFRAPQTHLHTLEQCVYTAAETA